MDRTPELVALMLEAEVLTFGDFTTKSGRKTPFFVNAGRYRTGAHLETLGELYADQVVATFGRDIDVLFGPAYKGIPLVATTAIALRRNHGLNVGWCFNRKEAKDHGEGGVLVGHTLADGDRVVIIEDVTTAGTSIRETVPILRSAADVVVAGLVVSVDRLERNTHPDLTALDEVGREFDFTTCAITDIDRIVAHLQGTLVNGAPVLSDDALARIAAYRAEWGVR
jgi:orotate phosphoribosyltransferase